MARSKRYKIFLDSNVLLSGLLSDKGPPRMILDLLTLNLPILCGATGRYNIIEVERNLKKKMPEAIPLYHQYVPKLGLEVVELPSRETVTEMVGAVADKDIPVLASAIACSADCLITGDIRDFGPLKHSKRYSLTIVSPSEFIEKVFPDVLKHIE
jgi:predicted nucleic acid-binding protein